MGERRDREERVKSGPHRRHRRPTFTRLVELTGGPAAPCTIVLPQGTDIQWGGMLLCDAAAFAWLHGPGIASMEPSEVLASQAAAFGLAYVRARKALTEATASPEASEEPPAA